MPYQYQLGDYRRSISTPGNDAEEWFNRGLIWLYGFDLELAGRCFTEAIKLDDNCAIAHWGFAYSSGIYYNKPWKRMQKDELAEKLRRTYDASRAALARIENASPVEAALIEALIARYQSPQPVDEAEYHRWDDDYADEMRTVYAAFADDDDVCALHAEALMTRTPWALWDLRSGEPAANASTLEAVDVLETAMQRLQAGGQKPHPGMLHMYIHVMEMSPFPEKALPACDALRSLVPDSGHLCHMPSHIDVRCGHYYEAVATNNRAIAADRVYLANEGAMNFHTLSRIHNFHLKIYAALFLGQFHTALAAADELIATTPEALLRIENPAMADWMEAYIGIKAHVFIRFGKWQEIIDEPLPADADLYRMTTALWHYAKTIAAAATNNLVVAKAQRKLFYEAVTRVPETRYIFNNTCLDVLKIAAQMLEGEIEYREKNYAGAYQHLRNAVLLDDNLKYDEPWGWMQPARHALGALLLEQGHVAEAKQVYRDDLGLSDTLVSTSQHRDNLWSLHGYVECLEREGNHDEAKQMQARLNLARARADVPVNASCACRLEHHCCEG
ncbi:MAG: tetratricopeptide (TPR) repeat protein [Planctomycetota bacterium]|jgi:tetratricopeptide (TPR) repeat protein